MVFDAILAIFFQGLTSDLKMLKNEQLQRMYDKRKHEHKFIRIYINV